MYIYRLKSLKREMVKNKQLAIQIDFEYQDTNFNVIFFNLEDMLLLFKKSHSEQYYLTSVEKDFSINSNLDKEDYKTLAKMFRINNSKKFSPYDFFISFAKSIPYHELTKQVDIKDNLNYISDYVDDIKNTKFIGYHSHKKDGRRVTAKNLNKTAIYLGKEEAERCKRENLSSVWKSQTKK